MTEAPLAPASPDALPTVRSWPDQHNLLLDVLVAAGGVDVGAVLPPGYRGEQADVLFEKYDVIAEVKSLATDRANESSTSQRLGAMLAQNAHEGAPVPFGSVRIGLHNLPERIAVKALRILGKRVQREAVKANRQIKATKAALGRTDSFGLLVLVTPPSGIDRHSLIWLVNDAVRGGSCSAINGLLLVETPIAAPFHFDGATNSFLSYHSRDGHWLTRVVRKRIGAAWSAVTGQPRGDAQLEDYRQHGATA